MVASVAANALYVLTLQILALVTLAPADFGAFSIQYLLFALTGSIGLSIICEPWSRSARYEGHTSSWRDYSSMTIYLAGAAGLVTVVASLIVPPLRPVAISGAIAVFASSYRAGARYYEVRNVHWNRVLASDISGLLVTVAAWAALPLLEVQELEAMSIAWAAGAVVSAVVAPLPHLTGFGRVRDWNVRHRRHIGPLLRDSLLMDLGAIGTPFVIAPLLGIQSFGVYRAVSNVAAPVRLVLNPIRATLASMPLSRQRAPTTILFVAIVSGLFGVGACVALLLVGAIQLDLGALSGLAPFAAATGVFVAFNFLGHYYYIVARSHAVGRALFTGRIVQTGLAVTLPVGGVLLWGLSGAIWGTAIATLCSAMTWTVLAAQRGGRVG